MTIDRVSGGFLLLVGLFVAWERQVLPLGTHSHPGPGYFPLLLSILLIITGSILVIRGRFSAPVRSIKWKEGRKAVAILGCCIVATSGIELIGYRITMIIILGFLFGVVERLKLWQVFVFTFLFSLGTYWVFNDLLRVILPKGRFGF
jgi:hypothetical protein